MTALECTCPGNHVEVVEPCTAPATQEDLLCDHCRAMDCPTVTTAEILTERSARIYGNQPAF